MPAPKVQEPQGSQANPFKQTNELFDQKINESVRKLLRVMSDHPEDRVAAGSPIFFGKNLQITLRVERA